ncbi:MAG: MFS transporter [Haliscomenobacteraceae bacterium CHB4]|nr:Inner membrane protein YbjJ [Saprospiraceae bacterium]MCE7924746.1 MFS transporter [Haliscomenobacteraceae bacterium CHB4]
MNASASFLARSLTKVITNLRHFFHHRLALATGLTFAADSLMFGSWVAHIPHVKTALGLNDAQLGLALFGMPIGLLAMNPFSPGIIARFGLARTTVGGTLAMAAAFALPVWMPERWALMAALVLVGAAVALVNVAMNTCATNIERADGIYIMSTCHGMWSLGGMVGSGTAAALIATGVAPQIHLSILAALVIAATLAWLRPALAEVPEEKQEEQSKGSKFILPNRDLLMMIFIGLAVSLSEGVAFDWSAVYLRDVLGAPEQIAALGFTCFSLTMMAMRFTGDVLIPRFGERNLLLFTALCSAFALFITIVAPTPLMGILGFLILGAGVALGAPILFNAAARVPGLAPGAGLATYATFSFIGFLAGPPVIGFIGEKFGLHVGFAMVAGLSLATLAAVRAVKL